MSRNTLRNGRSAAVSRVIEGENGWNRDPYDVPNAVRTWTDRFPNLPIVADGREVTGWNPAGRGTTAFDLFRARPGFVDFLSIKTDTIGSDGKLPSKLELSTGNDSTLRAILEGIEGGSALPTLVFASENDENGDPEPDGLALFLDLGPVLRGGIAPIGGGPYGKGEAPPAYYKWSSGRKCGGDAKWLTRAGLDFPHVDEQGRQWVAPDRVCYPELVVSLSALGLRRSDWTQILIYRLAALIEGRDWNTLSLF